MLQAADLTIRLNPADDVVIARVEIAEGTTLLKEAIVHVSGVACPPVTRWRSASWRSGRVRCGAMARSSASPRADRARRACPRPQPGDGRFRARLRFLRRRRPTDIRRHGRHLPGHRARRRTGGHPQLYRHPHQRELLGHGGRADFADACAQRARWPTSPMSTAWSRSPTDGCGMAARARGCEMLRRTMAGYARHPNFAAVCSSGWAARPTRSRA